MLFFTPFKKKANKTTKSAGTKSCVLNQSNTCILILCNTYLIIVFKKLVRILLTYI